MKIQKFEIELLKDVLFLKKIINYTHIDLIELISEAEQDCEYNFNKDYSLTFIKIIENIRELKL